MEENKQKNTLGIISLVLGIIAIVFSFISIISIPLAIASVITGIISIVKKQKKIMPVVGIVLSILSGIISILLIIVVVILTNKITNTVKDSEFQEELKSGLNQLYNDRSEDTTDELDVTNRLEGNSWKAPDGSLLELNEDGTFYWYKDPDDKTDNYYVGTYTSYLGDEAIEKIDENIGFDKEEYLKNSSIPKTDIYYLELEKESNIVNGQKVENDAIIIRDGIASKTIQTTSYALFFYDTDSDKCEGMNIDNQSLIRFTKVKN